MMTLIQERTQRFDRCIRNRNLRECIAAGLVFAFFLWQALTTPDTFTRAGSLIIMASAVWIVFYLVRYGGRTTRVDPNQNLASYTRALIESYDRQIRLQKSVKYWYLLLPYVGLLTLSVSSWLRHARVGRFDWWDVVFPVAYTVFFGAVWWLNEVIVVRHLQKARTNALAMAEQNELIQGEGR